MGEMTTLQMYGKTHHLSHHIISISIYIYIYTVICLFCWFGNKLHDTLEADDVFIYFGPIFPGILSQATPLSQALMTLL